MPLHSSAVISDDRLYRYWLERTWDSELPIVGWIMLNPSTADHQRNDPTVNTIMQQCIRWGYGGLVATNLYGFRASHPSALLEQSDPIGPDNDKWIRKLLDQHNTIVLAWGTKGTYLDRDKEVIKLVREFESENPRNVMCLGYTQHGQPVHPLGTIGPVRLEKFDYDRHRKASKRG